MASSAVKPELERAKAPVFNSWKEIATYLGRGVRTVQRWHSDLNLPVHKVGTTARSPVFAYRVEVDQWLRHNAQRGECSHIEPCHGQGTAAAERAHKSVEKMSLIVTRQHYHLTRLVAQLERLRELHAISVGKLRVPHNEKATSSRTCIEYCDGNTRSEFVLQTHPARR